VCGYSYSLACFTTRPGAQLVCHSVLLEWPGVSNTLPVDKRVSLGVDSLRNWS
jgi:hypothetical protein